MKFIENLFVCFVLLCYMLHFALATVNIAVTHNILILEQGEQRQCRLATVSLLHPWHSMRAQHVVARSTSSHPLPSDSAV